MHSKVYPQRNIQTYEYVQKNSLQHNLLETRKMSIKRGPLHGITNQSKFSEGGRLLCARHSLSSFLDYEEDQRISLRWLPLTTHHRLGG